MKYNLKILKDATALPDQEMVAVADWVENFEAELTAKRDHEIKLRKKGHLSKESDTVARVLILRYNEILGES